MKEEERTCEERAVRREVECVRERTKKECEWGRWGVGGGKLGGVLRGKLGLFEWKLGCLRGKLGCLRGSLVVWGEAWLFGGKLGWKKRRGKEKEKE